MMALSAAKSGREYASIMFEYHTALSLHHVVVCYLDPSIDKELVSSEHISEQRLLLPDSRCHL